MRFEITNHEFARASSPNHLALYIGADAFIGRTRVAELAGTMNVGEVVTLANWDSGREPITIRRTA